MIIKKGNKVKVLTGKDKNKEGEIIEIDKSKNRAKVKSLNIIKKHVKTTKEKKGGIFEKENFLHLSNLSIILEKIELPVLPTENIPIKDILTLLRIFFYHLSNYHF